MTNFEKYFDKCMDILAENLAFNTKKQEPTICSDCECNECLFQGVCISKNTNLYSKIREWLDTEYVEPQVDWSKVAVDTPILVKNHQVSEWKKRYFAKYENGKVCAFAYGRTSWSVEDDDNDDGLDWNIANWKYAKLYEEGGDN